MSYEVLFEGVVTIEAQPTRIWVEQYSFSTTVTVKPMLGSDEFEWTFRKSVADVNVTPDTVSWFDCETQQAESLPYRFYEPYRRYEWFV